MANQIAAQIARRSDPLTVDELADIANGIGCRPSELLRSGNPSPVHGLSFAALHTGYRADCLCGWSSEDRSTRRLASVEGQVHLSQVAREHARQIRESIEARGTHSVSTPVERYRQNLVELQPTVDALVGESCGYTVTVFRDLTGVTAVTPEVAAEREVTR